MAEFDTSDLNGRDEETSMYIAILERQVVGLTLTNIRQKAAIDSHGMEDISFDLDSAIDEAVSKIASASKDSKRMNRRSGV